jgi:uncharacterized protein (TIGR03437 family)
LHIQSNVPMKTLRTIAFLLPILAGWQAAAQSWDTSGNGMLNGTYYLREVVWVVGNDAFGDLQEAVSLYGQIKFDGNGNYSISGQENDSSGSGPVTFTASGTYTISASGYGSLTSPISKGDSVYGLVSKGIFIGSSTENGNGYNDLFVAAQLASPAPTNATFSGTYNMVDIDFPSGVVTDTRQSTFQLRPDGNGNIVSVQLTGYIAGAGSKVITQNISSRVPYFASNGAFNVNFGGGTVNPSSSTLIAGTKYLYISQDGNFVFGGDPQNAWDMILGVKQGTGAPNFSGLYYQAGALVDNSQLATNGPADLQTQYGALNVSSGAELVHERVLSVIQNGPIDYTYSDTATANADGTYSDFYNKYYFGTGGAIGVGIGTSTTFGVTALLQAPSFSGNGPYIYPTGILNAGSSIPFTAAFAPGELVTIYGTNLTSTTATDLTLPTTLGGVQVLVNNTPAPIAFVGHFSSYDQINAVIPLGTTTAVAAVQVTNGSGSSNVVTNYVNATQPGGFNSYTATPAVQHGADYSMVTSSNPAQVGETLLVYLTGLGTLTTSGNANSAIDVYFDGSIKATVSFAGSQSSVGGGYQMNVVVPSGVTNGNHFLDIAGSDSYNSEVVIPVGTGRASGAVRTAARMARPSVRSRTTAKSRRLE